MSQYFPPFKKSSGDINVKLDLSNYATKTDLKNVTHVDTSSLAFKTNLADLKSEIDKIDTDKLKTVPEDLAKLSNLVKNDVAKKTLYSSLKTKVDNIDTNALLLKITFNTKVTEIESKITKVDNKSPDITDLATKSSITSLLPTSSFNSKITEIENVITTVDNKIPNISNLATKTELKNVEDKIPNTDGFVKKSDYATEITSIRNDYVTNTALDSKLNDLKSQLVADELKKIDDKTKKNGSDILRFESRLNQKEDIADESQRENSYTRGFYYYLQESYLVYECRAFSFNKDNNDKLTIWKSTGTDNLSVNSELKAIPDAPSLLPSLDNNGRMNVSFSGN